MSKTTLNRAARTLCPVCLRAIDGRIVSRSNVIYLERICPEHGPAESRIWPDVDHYEWMRGFRLPVVRPQVTREPAGDCPRSCGLCTRHLRKTCLVEIEVTRRCNLRCPVCFMGAEDDMSDADVETIRTMYASILEEMGPNVSIQLTGGEPTVRSDLPEIVRLGASMGFSAIEVNTNGLALSRDPGLAAALKEAGASGIYLQFDGLTGEIYRQIRGADLVADKLRVIEHCRAAGLQVVLAMTIIKGINDGQIGDVLEFALQNIDVVAGLALQPAFFSGRFEVETPDRLSMGDVIFRLAEQSQGLIEPYDVWPLGCSHPLCSAGVLLVESEDKGFVPSSRLISPEEYVREFDPHSPQGSVFADLLARREGYAGRGLSVVVMNYMDAWTMDLERLQECSMTVKTAELRTVPFCAYHLSTRSAPD
ncbi:MAG: radical SAM protein [candidate division WOR-3 bacterium]